MFREIILLLALTSVAMAAVYFQNFEDKPEEFKNVPGCYITELNVVIGFGASAPSKKQCRQYNCNENNVQVFTCGVLAVEPPCVTRTDPSKPYPDCCPKPVCPPKPTAQPTEPTDCD